MVEKTFGAIARGYGFLKKQQRDWKITVLRSNLNMFFYRMVYPYMAVYIRELGATGAQLGMVNSIGMATSGLVGPVIGWIIDRIGVKRIYLIGIVLLAVSYLVYGLAQSWAIIIIAMAAYWLGMGMAGLICNVVCGNCLVSKERATGMAICETVGMGGLGMAAPMVGAWLVTTFGGVNVEGIRPLFFISLAGMTVTFILILTQLSNRKWVKLDESGSNFFKGISQVFKQGHHLKRWLLIASGSGLQMGMVLPFVYPFAHEFKGADQYILGAMVTVSAVVPFLLGIPMGRLADKIGRKKVLYSIAPFVWASYLVLIWAPGPGFLIVSGVLLGFLMLTTVITAGMGRELVPPEQMGRWMGILRSGRMLFSAGAVYLAGVIWDGIGPQYVFLIIIAMDILRILLLIGMPETLGLRLGTEQPKGGGQGHVNNA
ncbi:hypothetical protein ES708_13087 [subsurface metagenome]